MNGRPIPTPLAPRHNAFRMLRKVGEVSVGKGLKDTEESLTLSLE